MFDIHPDIRQAQALPGSFYTDPAVYEVVRRQVLAQGVHVLPPPTDDPTPFRLLPGSLDEPLLRTATGVLSNVCTHRSARLLDSPCTGPRIRCPYHGRSFHRDGTLAGAPGFDDVAWRPSDDLPSRASLPLGPVELVALGSEPPDLAAARRLLDTLDWSRVQVGDDTVHPIDVNWAVYVENYLEGLHVPFVHPGLQRSLDGYRVEVFSGGALQVGLSDEGPWVPLGRDHPLAGERVAALYVWFFPGTMLNVYPWGLSLNVVEPLGPSRMQVRYRAYVVDAALRAVGAGGNLGCVELEDQAIVRRVQDGLGATMAGRGRFSPDHERAVHHFQRIVAGYLQSET